MQLGMQVSARLRTAGVILALAALVVAGLAVGPPKARAASAPDDDWVETTLAEMTLEEKVGQLFMTNVYGSTADTQDPADVADNQKLYGVDNAEQLIDRYQPGGIIYFAWTNSVQNPDQIAGLSNGIQDAALSQRHGRAVAGRHRPGGRHRRPDRSAGHPAAGQHGARRRPQQPRRPDRRRHQRRRARGDGHQLELRARSPTSTSTRPTRSSGSARSARTRAWSPSMTAAQTRGYTAAGVAGAAKHFPGHGDTATDSHTGLPVIDHTREEWEQLDRPPFQAAIDAGVPAIMTAHISVPALDPSGDPATLSEPIMTGILREELGYDGVVITDALDMAGASATYGNDRVPVLALKAGVDMLLMPPEFDVAYNAVLEAVETGELTEERIDTSVRRILTLKQDLGIVDDPYVDPAEIPAHVGTPEHLDTVQGITDRTTTLVRNQRRLLPLSPDSGEDALVTGWGVSTTATVAAGLAERGVASDVLETGAQPRPGDDRQRRAAGPATATTSS